MSSIRLTLYSFVTMLGMALSFTNGDAAPMPQRIFTGLLYKGICQGRAVSIELDSVPYENPYVGTFIFGANSNQYTVRCFRTGSASIYEARILRMTNPAILGEYLAWRANIEVIDSETIKLTVVKDLSAVEKVKYDLPPQGTSATLKIQGGQKSTDPQSEARAGLLRGVQVFTGSVSINSQSLQVSFNLDFSSGSGQSRYSSSPLPLTISSIQEYQNSATFTLTERNPNRTSIPNNQLGGNTTAVYYCTYNSDGSITGRGQNFKGQTFTFSLRKIY